MSSALRAGLSLVITWPMNRALVSRACHIGPRSCLRAVRPGSKLPGRGRSPRRAPDGRPPVPWAHDRLPDQIGATGPLAGSDPDLTSWIPRNSCPTGLRAEKQARLSNWEMTHLVFAFLGTEAFYGKEQLIDGLPLRHLIA
jgi:hypothetical protein